jgi:hypothetical protein
MKNVAITIAKNDVHKAQADIKDLTESFETNTAKNEHQISIINEQRKDLR